MAAFPQVFGSDPDVCREASPTTYVKKDSVPMLVITETKDTFFVRPSMEQLRKAVEAAGNTRVEFADAKDRNHISIVVQLFREGEEEVRDRVVEFVKKRCRELDGGK